MSPNVWDEAAATFDDEPDHGLTDPAIRAAWRDLLLGFLPPAPARVADLGCGTGTLTRLLADEGYDVDGLDSSQAMIERARAKVPEARFVVGDANLPALTRGFYDAVVSRHVLWAMTDPALALSRWDELLNPDGVIVLVEGRWFTGTGLSALRVEQLLRGIGREARVTRLTDPIYWGKRITDERFVAAG
jgi:SAM-dependent methyltransferase